MPLGISFYIQNYIAIVEAEKVADLLDDLEEENYYRELSEDALADEI